MEEEENLALCSSFSFAFEHSNDASQTHDASLAKYLYKFYSTFCGRTPIAAIHIKSSQWPYDSSPFISVHLGCPHSSMKNLHLKHIAEKRFGLKHSIWNVPSLKLKSQHQNSHSLLFALKQIWPDHRSILYRFANTIRQTRTRASTGFL